jgi:hypothetical protein
MNACPAERVKGERSISLIRVGPGGFLHGTVQTPAAQQIAPRRREGVSFMMQLAMAIFSRFKFNPIKKKVLKRMILLCY